VALISEIASVASAISLIEGGLAVQIWSAAKSSPWQSLRSSDLTRLTKPFDEMHGAKAGQLTLPPSLPVAATAACLDVSLLSDTLSGAISKLVCATEAVENVHCCIRLILVFVFNLEAAIP
jgi:hypothetical protein